MLSDILWAVLLWVGFVVFVVGSFFVCDWWAGKRIDELGVSRVHDRDWETLKGERRMPRLLWAKKDVVSCEKLRGSANEI